MLFAMGHNAAIATTSTATAVATSATARCWHTAKRKARQRWLAVGTWRLCAAAITATAARVSAAAAVATSEASARRREAKGFQELIVVEAAAEGSATARLQASRTGRRRRSHQAKRQLVVVVIIVVVIVAANFSVVVARGKSGGAASISIVVPVVDRKPPYIQLPCMTSPITSTATAHGVRTGTSPRCPTTTAARRSMAKSLAARALQLGVFHHRVISNAVQVALRWRYFKQRVLVFRR